MVLPQGSMRRSRAITSRGNKRRRDAVQTRIRGGCSGGGWPRPSGHESFRSGAISFEAVGNGCKTIDDMPVKHLDTQAVMYTHLSQPTGGGAFDGQHGMSLTISSIVTDGDISSDIACTEASEDISAMTGRETGANARPAITRVASSRRMAKLRFINPESHKMAANERLQPLHGVENSSYCYPLSAVGAVFRRAGTRLRSCRAAVLSSTRGSASSFDVASCCRGQDAGSCCCGLRDVKNRDRCVLSGNAVSSADPRGPCLTHRNIINAHGSTATMRSNPAAVSQFQFRTTSSATAAPEKRYSARRYRQK